ncbi:magnesium transporter [Mesoplasma entomophilum]|uniref:Magnesium transporter MgtE n=1 Tax=Mesoplasma entomophilum TaxID=2149 RepID=A0A3S5XYP0_9MOLU|nr:magnesium transporter [Mesoplasma entomophilum]ATQ35374.1 magnesium transporter [Mesoplasma entomophilum]ATZ19329.1 Mg2+ transport protein [Mesoplasma entomophilum]AVN60233.1 magnesium transporter [Mesoplasma entomophilum]
MLKLDHIEEMLEKALEEKDVKKIRSISKEFQFVDFAEAMEQFESKKVLKIFRLLELEEAAEIFTYLDSEHQEYIIEAFTNTEIQEIMDELYTDDIIDLIDEMPSEVVKKILKATTKDVRKELNNILKYKEHTAGAIMSINFTELKADNTVEMAIKAIKRRHDDYDEIDDLFIIDEHNKLLGWIELKQLLINSPKTKLGTVMNSKIVNVNVEMDQEEVANYFKRYDINTLPVVNKNQQLVGIITVDDVIDVLVEESTEDIQNFAGIDADDVESDYFETSIFKMYKSRVVWLSILLLIGVITHVIMLLMFNLVEGLKDLPSGKEVIMMIPILIVLAGVSGNIANQSSLMMIRSLALNQVHKKEIKTIFGKELLVGFLLGITLAFINVIRLLIIYAVQEGGTINHSEWMVVLFSTLGILVVVMLANLLGILLPLLLKKIKKDPTIASSPLITSLVDILCVLVFIGFALIIV